MQLQFTLMKMNRYNTTPMGDQMDKMNFDSTWASLQGLVKEERFANPYSGLKVACLSFEPPIRCNDCDLIVCAVMKLLFTYAYTTKSSYGKFTILYKMMNKKTSEIYSFTIGPAITFRENGIDLSVNDLVEQQVEEKAEEYEDAEITGICIRIYLLDMKDGGGQPTPTSAEEIASKVWESMNMNRKSKSKEGVEPKGAGKIKQR